MRKKKQERNNWLPEFTTTHHWPNCAQPLPVAERIRIHPALMLEIVHNLWDECVDLLLVRAWLERVVIYRVSFRK
jgi:hypothetical protein